ncbi:MAG: hypothetical protein R3A10_21990 [Caldilineaceae bacterium]
MTAENRLNLSDSNTPDIGFPVLAITAISLQNVAIKLDRRRLFGVPDCDAAQPGRHAFTLLFFRLEGGRRLPITGRHRLQYLRGALLFLSYTTFMMGLAAFCPWPTWKRSASPARSPESPFSRW